MTNKSAIATKVQESGLRVGRDFLDGIELAVDAMVKEAINRAKWSKRKTIRRADIPFLIGDLGPQDSDLIATIKTERREEKPTKPVKEVGIGRTNYFIRQSGTGQAVGIDRLVEND